MDLKECIFTLCYYQTQVIYFDNKQKCLNNPNFNYNIIKQHLVFFLSSQNKTTKSDVNIFFKTSN